MKDFKLLWDIAIKPLIDFTLDKDKKIQLAYNPEKELDTCKNVESKYNCLRDDTKRELMRWSDNNAQLENLRLDRHKLCACVYAAFVESKLQL